MKEQTQHLMEGFVWGIKIPAIPDHHVAPFCMYFNYGKQIFIHSFDSNRSCSIYQYSNMAPRLSGQTSIFGVVFFVSKSLLGIERQKKLEKFTILT